MSDYTSSLEIMAQAAEDILDDPELASIITDAQAEENATPVSLPAIDQRAATRNMLEANVYMLDKTEREQREYEARLEEIRRTAMDLIDPLIERAYGLGYIAGMSGSDQREAEATQPLIERISDLESKNKSLDMEYCTLQAYSQEARDEDRAEIVELSDALDATKKVLEEAVVLLNRLYGLVLSGQRDANERYIINGSLINNTLTDISHFVFEREREHSPGLRWDDMGG